MRLLLRSDTGALSLTEYLDGDDRIPQYAILSHRWLAETDEPTFEDLKNGTGEEKLGYEKLRFCGEQARRNGLRYFWVDTCCINKANDAETSTAINSMFRWYRNAARCYVYLSDVSINKREDRLSELAWESAFRASSWFQRGWTLQELLAPSSVEFFSRERERLGDKRSLGQQIYEITGIPKPALQGALLSRFSIKERFSWIERRKTKVEEDRAYSLLGIFDVHIPLRYGEGMASAFKRLEEEIDRLNKCLQDLYLTDPRDDKKRIEDTKGGLLEDSYRWILENPDYQQWYKGQQSGLLWVKGDPGKGKTMLLCGVVNELNKPTVKATLVSYFFCQATDARINNHTAILRGLMYMLVSQQPSLVSHIRMKYDHAGKALFEDVNAWFALSEMFTSILQDPSLSTTYLVVDALDECVVHLETLLKFIAHASTISRRVKWIVSSRNWPHIVELLDGGAQVKLCLELNTDSVSRAVNTYIQHKVLELAQRKKYDDKTRTAVLQHLESNADDTFLWVALACQNLEKIWPWNTIAKLNAFPPGLDALYKRMIEQICNSDDADLCERILALTAIVYQPITLNELTSLVEPLEDMSDDLESLDKIIGLCGSFLVVREGTVYFVHQSAKDYLLKEAAKEIFPSGQGETHRTIFLRSLKVLTRNIRRDIYNMGALGRHIDEVSKPEPDPLSSLRYSCIYWIDHLCDADTLDEGAVEAFVRQKYLYWLEALSLCRSLSKGVESMDKLEALVQARLTESSLVELVRDARRLIRYHKHAIENAPLQAYASALIFSPANSLIRDLFKYEEPKWITIKPPMRDEWSSCLQTLEGHHCPIALLAVSRDSTRLVSVSYDGIVKIWEASSGKCLQTLGGHSFYVSSVALSRDWTRFAWASMSADATVKIWDTSSGKCLQTLAGHRRDVTSLAFTHDLTRLASGSYDCTVKIWDTRDGKCLQTLEGHSRRVKSVVFTHDSTRLASASDDGTVKIWDTRDGKCLRTLEGHSEPVNSIVFTHDSTRLASASDDRTVKIWDTRNGKCLQTLDGHTREVSSVVFIRKSTRLASASADSTVRLWETSSGKCRQTLQSHSSIVRSVVVPRDLTRFASTSDDGTLKIWDTRNWKCLRTFKWLRWNFSHVAFTRDSSRLAMAWRDGTVKIWKVSSGKRLYTLKGNISRGTRDWLVFTHDSTRLALTSADATVKIWDISSGKCLQTLKGHSEPVVSVTFTRDSTRIASDSADGTVRIWNTLSGECLHTLEGHVYRQPVTSVVFTRDSTRLASASSGTTVKIWDTSNGKCLMMLECPGKAVYSVAFTHDMTRIASSLSDCTVKVWDVSSGKCLQTLKVDQIFLDISFDATGSFLHTEIGTVAVGASSPSDRTVDLREPQKPRYRGASLSSDREWVMYNSENVLWLPPEYRPPWPEGSRSAVLGETLWIGAGSGRVWMCSFNVENS